MLFLQPRPGVGPSCRDTSMHASGGAPWCPTAPIGAGRCRRRRPPPPLVFLPRTITHATRAHIATVSPRAASFPPRPREWFGRPEFEACARSRVPPPRPKQVGLLNRPAAPLNGLGRGRRRPGGKPAAAAAAQPAPATSCCSPVFDRLPTAPRLPTLFQWRHGGDPGPRRRGQPGRRSGGRHRP